VLANFSHIVRWSAVVTAIVAAVMVAVCAAIGGTHGLIGALLGVALVAVFFGIDVLVIGRMAKISPQAIMGAAIGLYLFKIIALAVAVKLLSDASFFNGKLFGVTALVCILAYCAAQMIASIRHKTLYVNPDSVNPDGER
jgi:ATP synthase protein I